MFMKLERRPVDIRFDINDYLLFQLMLRIEFDLTGMIMESFRIFLFWHKGPLRTAWENRKKSLILLVI